MQHSMETLTKALSAPAPWLRCYTWTRRKTKGAGESGGPGPGSTEATDPGYAAVAAEAVKRSQDP